MMGLFVCVQGYDAKKVASVDKCISVSVFRSCDCNVQWHSNTKEGLFGYFVMRGIIGDCM